MKKKNILTIFLITTAFFIPSNIQARGIVLKSGNLSVLKSEKKINVQFDYSNMTVGKDLSEEEYVNRKVSEHNAKEKGKGDKWKAAWISARKERYQPKFIELFNKESEKTMRTISDNASDAKYTIIVKTVYTEPGFNIGIMRQPARVNFVFLVVETSNPANVAAELNVDGVPGAQAMGYDFDAGSRLAESYAKGGKMLAKFLSGKIK